ncbi:MAG: hydroxyacid dehydrogenase [Halobacteriovoraceae bacterium]|nr:hydroxyacid dehydrogenase [Halobacteriovoraceae bacterium]
MKPLIVVCDGMDKEEYNRLLGVSQFEVRGPKLSQEEITQLLPNAAGLIIRSATNITVETLEKAQKLKYVIRAGEGTDNIDLKACQTKGVKVSNTPGANNNSAAEHAVALLMTVLRHTAAADKSMKEGKWEKSKYTGVELLNKKVGVVGFGRIGQIFAKRIGGFEPEILFYDPFIEKTDLIYANKAESLEQIFSECEIISLHTPLTESTKGFVNSKLLNLMQPNSILINASRGGIVNEDDLYSLLSEGKIRGAGFDVFNSEPLEKESKLSSLSNLVLTPHLGASTEEAQIRVGAMAVQQMQEFFINNNLLNEVKA